jgi:protein associated with RNAse G/E
VKPGDTIWVRIDKADGSPHRWWQTRVEAIEGDCLVTWTVAGSPMYHNADRFPKAVYPVQWFIRNYYWSGRRYDLLEVYDLDGQLHELYADVTSPVEVTDDEIRFIDHELDVQMFAGQTPRIVDQDEFAEAAEQYGYSEEFVRESYALAEELLVVLAEWQPRGV